MTAATLILELQKLPPSTPIYTYNGEWMTLRDAKLVVKTMDVVHSRLDKWGNRTAYAVYSPDDEVGDDMVRETIHIVE